MMSILSMLIITLASATLNEPLILISDDLIIRIQWNPVEIKPNHLVTFRLEFLKYDKPIAIHYDFIVEKDNEIIKEVRDSFANDGVAEHIVEFPSSGSFKVMIKVEDRILSFDLKVTPEFPLGSMIVIVTLIAITIVLARSVRM